jgi:hypothetical protein
MPQSSRAHILSPLLGSLLLVGACESSPPAALLAPTESSLSSSPAPVIVHGAAIGAREIKTLNLFKGPLVHLVTDPYGTLVLDSYQFDATRTKSGNATGTFDFVARYQHTMVHLHGTIVCYTSNGQLARVGGVVTQTDFSGIPVGTSETWSVTNNGSGKGWPDTGSSFYGGNATYALGYCANGLPYPELPLLDGNIVIAQ